MWVIKTGTLPGLKVIDGETRRIVYAVENLEYLALSYVWGSMSSGEPSYQVDSTK